jgi:hypothetical protein
MRTMLGFSAAETTPVKTATMANRNGSRIRFIELAGRKMMLQ